MKLWDIRLRSKNYMSYLDYGPKTTKKRRIIDVRQLGLKKVVIVRRNK